MVSVYEEITKDIVLKKQKTIKSFPNMLHKQLEFVYVKEGSFKTCIDGNDIILEAGELYVILPYIIHSSEKTNAELYCLMFDPILFPKFNDIFTSKKPIKPYLRANEIPKCIPQLFEYMFETQEKTTAFHKINLNAYIKAFIGEIFDCLEFVDIANTQLNTSQKVILYCMNHYLEDISIYTISKKLCISKTYIARIFSNKFNCNFRTYINKLRVRYACQLLMQTEHSVTEIMYLSGFWNQSTFNKAFIKECKVTPHEYRKKKANMFDEDYGKAD